MAEWGKEFNATMAWGIGDRRGSDFRTQVRLNYVLRLHDPTIMWTSTSNYSRTAT